MSVIEVHRAHTLDKAHARQLAETLAEDLSRQFHMQYQWEGDVMTFRRNGVRGQLTLTPDDLHVRLELGLVLRPFRQRIEQEIHSQLDQVLGA